ncbi:type II toxin-antitoxin system HipA family toxin [Roseateles sp. L2-2]|uniref:type II toxin-antitoxin system HipA family toxin n=1 Tax=Roseateles sp. L2-2 TaxID=3422597 RepID=UPI003D3644B2
MATRTSNKPGTKFSTKQTATVCLGETGIEVGELSFETSGTRRSARFEYHADWLERPGAFALSPDLPLVNGPQFHSPKEAGSPAFFGCISDIEPDGWGRMVIKRDHANQRKHASASAHLPALLTDFDYLQWVSDFGRMGALRLRDSAGEFQRTSAPRDTPALIALPDLVGATRAVELNQETARDLAFLRGNGTSLGGLRPKCSVMEEDGALAIGKFASVTDTRSVVHGEVLALALARAAGINAAIARVVDAQGIAVAVVRRFDRIDGKRLMYLSARSLMQARGSQQYAYTDIAESIREHSADAASDLAELWRRLVFNILINNVDDHLNNHGFLHVAHGQWRLAPAFDINPFPDKARALKTWVSPDSGDGSSLSEALRVAGQFNLSVLSARTILSEVKDAVTGWRNLARNLGMSTADMASFAPAFEHRESIG